MSHDEVSRIVSAIARQCRNAAALSTIDCLQALDRLEFHVLDPVDQGYANPAQAAAENRARQLHARLTAMAQTNIDNLVHDIRTRRLSPLAVRAILDEVAQSAAGKVAGDTPDYDLFDDFLNNLFQVDDDPSETQTLTSEMVTLQPTPGRVILELIKALPFTPDDCFTDLGSGLGRVALMVSLLTDTPAVGIEIEPTYARYARRSAQKLGLERVEFRAADARDADLSDGTIFFMFTPFTGSILRRVLNRLRDLSAARPVTLCTYGPSTPVIERETWLYPLRPFNGKIYRLTLLTSAAPA